MIKTLRTLVEKVAKPSMVVFEVGVWDGESTVTYLDIIKANRGKMIAIDTFEGSPTIPDYHAYKPENADKVYASFKENIAKTGCGDVVVTMRMRSSTAARFFKPASVDLVFIDADHRYSHISEDIKLFKPLVKPGGILAGHDFDCHYSNAPAHTYADLEIDFYKGVHLGVSKAVCESFVNFNVLEESVWYVQL